MTQAVSAGAAGSGKHGGGEFVSGSSGRRTPPAHRRSGLQELLLAGSDVGGERAAAIYSLIGTAKLNGLYPEAYLRNALSRIAPHPINHIDELLLWNLATNPIEQSLHAA